MSSITGDGMAEMLEKIEEFRNEMSQNGELQRLRRKQYVRWMHNHLQDSLNDVFKHLPLINDLIPRLEEKVILGTITPGQAADKVNVAFFSICFNFFIAFDHFNIFILAFLNHDLKAFYNCID